VIGTSSRRREVQILRLRPDARIVNIRGNIDTRLRKAAGPDFDAIVLAAAGIHRLGWGDRICEYFPVERVVPSPGQGAIAVQARAGSDPASVLVSIDDRAVSAAVAVERAFLAAIGAGCAYPVGAYAAASDGGYRFIAMLADPEGKFIAWADESLDIGEERRHAAAVAARLRAEVGQAPAPSSWNGWTPEDEDLQGARIVVTRARQQAGPLTSALTERGGTAIALPTIRIEPVVDLAPLDAAIDDAHQGAFDWLVFTSANAVEIVSRRIDALNLRSEQLTALKVAAVGEATAAATVRAGLNLTLVAEAATGDALAASLCRQMRPASRVLYPKSAIGREALPKALQTAGFDVLAIDVYRTVPEPDVDLRALEQVRRGEIDLITFASPSSVRNFIDLVGLECTVVRGIPVVCVGAVTAEAARDAGLLVVAVSDAPDALTMTEAVATYWQSSVRGQPAAAMASTFELERSAV
jgi:uroporphyrinogen-III synthase